MFQWAVITLVTNTIQVCVLLIDVVQIRTVVLLIQYT